MNTAMEGGGGVRVDSGGLGALTAFGSEPEPPRGIGHWDALAYGHHRAIVHVEAPADAVLAHVPWRRPDRQPESKEVVIIDAATGAPRRQRRARLGHARGGRPRLPAADGAWRLLRLLPAVPHDGAQQLPHDRLPEAGGLGRYRVARAERPHARGARRRRVAEPARGARRRDPVERRLRGLHAHGGDRHRGGNAGPPREARGRGLPALPRRPVEPHPHDRRPAEGLGGPRRRRAARGRGPAGRVREPAGGPLRGGPRSREP